MRRSIVVLLVAASSACDYSVHVASLREDTGRPDGGSLEGTPTPGDSVELFIDGTQILGDYVAYVDLDGDGMDDIVIPDRQADDTLGLLHRGGGLYILYGRVARLDARVDLGTEAVHVIGPTHDALGNGVIPVRGDFDGDGREDLAVAVGPGIATAGTVHVLYGSPERLSGTPFIEDLGPTLDGVGIFGESLANAGDLDGDGCDELAVGADEGVVVVRGSHTRWSGRAPADVATVFTGSPSNVLASVQSAGDLDRDGAADVIAADLAGHFGLFYGPITLDGAHALAGADATIEVSINSATSLVATDLDGDGFGDIALSDANGIAAEVDVFLGGPRRFVASYVSGDATLRLQTGPEDANAVALSAGDANGDGRIDLLVGVPGFNGNVAPARGAAYRIFGPIVSGGALANAPVAWRGHDLPPDVTGDAPSELLGYAVAQDGDFDGDGLADALLTAPTNHIGASGEHRVYLSYGRTD